MDTRNKLIDQSNWLSRIPRELAEALLAQGRTTKKKVGEGIYQFGDPPGDMFCIISGVVAIQTEDSETGVIIGHLLGRGCCFGENAILSGMPRQIGAVAKSGDCHLLSISIGALESIGAEFPQFWRALAGLCAMNANIAVQTARDLMIREPELRCEAVLKRVSVWLEPNAPIPLSQEELAVMCALSRGSVSRALKALQDSGRVSVGYGKIWAL